MAIWQSRVLRTAKAAYALDSQLSMMPWTYKQEHVFCLLEYVGKDEESVPTIDLMIKCPLYNNSFSSILSVLEEIDVPDAEIFLN